MMRTCFFWGVTVCLGLAGCRGSTSKGAEERWVSKRAQKDAGQALTCTKDPNFVTQLRLPEASGATFVPGLEGSPPYLLVVGDSGTKGQFLALDPATGRTIGSGLLPLDEGASDDLEGLSVVGTTFYGVTSSGWMRHWRRGSPNKYVLTQSSYPLATRDHRPHLVCKTGRKTNCARNYEGLCLRNQRVSRGECAGYLASKKDGHLYCLVWGAEEGRAARLLTIDPHRTIPVAPRQTLTGCHFWEGQDVFLAGTNAFGGNAVYEISPTAGQKAKVRKLGSLGRGFCEALATAGIGVIYRFSDMGGARSWADRYQCASLGGGISPPSPK